MPPADRLPIEDVVPEVRNALRTHAAAVLSAPAGSGKTTVVPLRLRKEPWLEGRKVVVLEPRRLATRAAASWMAHLIGEKVGETVGYVTRDDRRTGRDTRIEVITEGVLTRRLQRDPELAETALVIFDELHERNLQTDLGLALALDARRHIRPDLRILAMSATIATDEVAALIGDGAEVPVIHGEARMFPVEIRWAPPRRKLRMETHVVGVLRDVLRTESGDVLVFLPGMGEMRRVGRGLRDAATDVDVRLLHGSLSAADQDAALNPSPLGRRRLVLATDIAETSLTVEGVRVVVDSGLARKPRFDARTGMTRLRTVPISRASAEQRAGRAGRVEPGVAIRLWSKLEHGSRQKHITPEIDEVDLAGFALELAAWGSPPEELSFLDPPPPRTLEEGRGLLQRLGAIDENGDLTAVGGLMATLPLHPRLAHMVVAAGSDGGLACAVAAILEARDPLRGHPDELPVDLAVRVALVAERGRHHPQADGRAVDRIREVARDLAHRAGVGWGEFDPERTGHVLALAYPDRLAVRRGSPGRFQLRTGTTAWMRADDALATAPYLVASDLDGKRKDARIRLAAAIDTQVVIASFSHEIDERQQLTWERERLVLRRERRLGGIVLDRHDERPGPGPKTAAALARRLAERRLADLTWTPPARSLQQRITYLHRNLGDPWPDWSDATLSANVADWLGRALAQATGLDDVAGIDVRKALLAQLDHGQIASIERLAPSHVTVPSGRRLAVDYEPDTPTVRVRVQEMFGSTSTPQVGGAPVRIELLSPAGRPLQITSDLAGFWQGSWHDVRKEMAGRYPKHDWPDDPAGARPSRK